MKRLFQFIKYQLSVQLLRRRWLLPLPVFLFLSYRAWNYLTTPGALPVLATSASVNAWDMLFLVFGNVFNVYFAICLLFMYLVSDLSPENDLGQQMLVRLKSRRLWWIGKTVTLLCLVLIYLAIAVLLVGIIAGATLPWGSDYSSQAQSAPESVNLSMRFIRVEEPPAGPFGFLLLELSMIALGLFSFGLAMLIINQLTGKYYIGLITIFALIMLSYSAGMLNGPPEWTLYLPGRHLTFIDSMPVRKVPFEYSFIYWGIWILLTWVAGFFISRRQNHYAIQE